MLAQRNQKIIAALKQSHLFSKLTELQLDRVYLHCTLITLSDGELLFAQGDEVADFYLVLSGKVKLFRVSPDGQEKIIEIVSQGQTFAEALMFIDEPHYPVNSAALETTVVVAVDAKNFKSMLWDSVDTCLLLLGEMSLRLHKLVHEIDTLTLHSGTCRVASYLLEQAPQDQACFDLDIAKSVIAARLSIKPETLSRIIKNLREQRIISIEGSKITIHDRQALRSLSIDKAGLFNNG
jgi:CRP-like cAMP-binding protein